MRESVLVILCILPKVYSLSCAAFGCTTNTTSCIYQVNATYTQVSPCGSNEYCSSNGTCSSYSPSASNLPAGVGCNATFTCRNTCEDGICTGLPSGSSCNSTLDCDQTSYCSESGNCTDLISIGNQCTSYSQCIQGSGCFNSLCTRYYSIPNGGILQGFSCFRGTSNFCSSGQCHPVNSEYSMCIAGYRTSSYLNPTPCSSSLDCKGVSGDYTNYGSCLCSQGSNVNTSYCSNQLGDYYSLNYIQLLKAWYSSYAVLNCNIEAAIELCMLKNWGSRNYYEFLYYQYLMQYEYLVVNTEECVMQAIDPYFLKLRQMMTPEPFPQVECPNYSYANKASQNCIQGAGDNSFSVWYCPKKSYCDATSYSCKVENYAMSNLGAGVACNSTFTCSGSCVKGICQGIPIGTSCSNNLNCSADAYCSADGNCEKLIAVGDDCDESEDVCVQGSGCFEGICTKYYSIPNGVSIPFEYCNSQFNVSAYCTSGQCYSPGLGDPICIEAFVTIAGSPAKCRSNTDCLVRSGSYSGYGQCTCSYGAAVNSSYCEVQLGDYWGGKYFTKLMQWLGSSNRFNCNADADLESCMRTYWDEVDYFEFRYYQYMFVNLPLITGVDNKTLEVLAPEYFYLLKNQKHSHSQSHFLAVSLALALLVCI